MPETDNRVWTRILPDEAQVQLKTAGSIIAAEVVDVSFGGIAVQLDRRPALQAGAPVDVNWRGAWMRGVVRYVDESGNRVRLGIEWAKR